MAYCEETERLFDCWSDDGGSGKLCRSYGVQRPQLCTHDNASDSSLHSCNSVNTLKQWTTSTMCCPTARCSGVPCWTAARSSKKRRSRSAGGDGELRNCSSELLDACDFKKVNYSRCTTTKKRLMNQGRYAANCLLSDTSDIDNAELDWPLDDVDVDDDRPALVELMSCNSSFSDCSLPCHELITFSPPTQLAKGHIKVSIRPPVVTAENQCFDGDRYNIKFASHFVDIPDNQEAVETNVNGKSTEDNNNKKGSKEQKSSSTNQLSEKGSNDQMTTSTIQSSKSAKNSSSIVQSSKSAQSGKSLGHDSKRRPASIEGKHPKNKNKSSRSGRNWSTSTSEQSELENSYDDMRGMSNSNRRTSKSWRRYSSSNENFDGEESSQCTQSMSSEEDPETNNLSTVTDLDSELTDEQEIVILYGKLRQITRGPTTNNPADVQSVVAAAEEDKETLSPLTVVTELPRIVGPVETSTNQSNIDEEQRDMVTISLHEDDDDGSPTPSVRSEATRKAGRAAFIRATRTQSVEHDRKCLSTSDTIGMPSSPSAPLIPTLRDSVDDVSDTSSIYDAALVVARRTIPLRGRGALPWLTSSTDDRGNGRTAAADITKSSLLPPPVHSRHQQQQQKHQAPMKRCRRDSTTSLPQLPQPDVAKNRSEIEHLMAPGVTADLPLEAAMNPTDRKIVVNVCTDSATLLPPALQRTPPAPAPPRQLASCLKYHSDAGPSSTSLAADWQRRRKIRFASEVKQRTFY